MITRLLLSRSCAIVLLVCSTVFDCGTAYATVGGHLSFDGNPFIGCFNWGQLIGLQAAAVVVVSAVFLAVRGLQGRIWPKGPTSFWSFLVYRLKKEFTLTLTFDHLKTEAICAGVLMLWFITFMHSMAGITQLLPLMGGPSVLTVMQRIGIYGLRPAQNAVIVIGTACSFLVAHYPLYLGAMAALNKTMKTR